MFNELHDMIKKYLNRINANHDLGSSEICFYPVAPEDGRFLPEISDGEASCVYRDDMAALVAAQDASFEHTLDEVWERLKGVEILHPQTMVQDLKDCYFHVLIREELNELSNKIPEEFWDYNQFFETCSECPVYVESHFDVDGAIDFHPELEEEILAYQSKCLEAGTLIIHKAWLALNELNMDPYDFRDAKPLINEAFSTELDFGDAPWTKKAHELINEICKD